MLKTEDQTPQFCLKVSFQTSSRPEELFGILSDVTSRQEWDFNLKSAQVQGERINLVYLTESGDEYFESINFNYMAGANEIYLIEEA